MFKNVNNEAIMQENRKLSDELETWKRNRHFIWIIAVVSAFCTYMSVSNYYKLEVKRLQQKLEQQQLLCPSKSSIELNEVLSK